MIDEGFSAARISLVASTIALVGTLWDLSWHTTLADVAPYAPAHFALAVAGVTAMVAAVAQGRGRRTGCAKATRRINAFAALALFMGAATGLAIAPTISSGVSLVDPAHILLAIGVVALSIGSFLAWGEKSVLCGSVAIGFAMASVLALATDQLGPPNLWRGAGFYQTSCAILPALLVTSASGWKRGGSATLSATAYTAAMLAAMWLLPWSNVLGPADQRLVSPFFPLILLPAAVAIDWLFAIASKPGGLLTVRSAKRGGLTAIVAGSTFLAVVLPVHWVAAPSLISPSAHTALYSESPWPGQLNTGDWRFELWSIDSGPRIFASGLAIALILAVLSSWAGLFLGRWIRDTSSSDKICSE